ncbi:MAG: hypothetical protein MR999_03130 [Flintibacter sp.]|uniref:hypothetical protein n=1 Tax=Flintibacter sp. TaxID=1918624 RepID=UPI002D7F91AD|nr:hypothetical protein [Flintibacter sp.]MCI7158409.1 hypothetical protein [Flintibacter sp.]
MKRRDMIVDFPRPLVPLAALSTCFLLGGALGAVFGGLMSETSAQELADYLSTYFTLAREGGVTVEFWSVAWEQFRLLIAVILLGLTALGAAGIPLLFGVRGFLLAFSVAGLCRVFGAAGLVPALFLFGLPAFFWAPILFLTGGQCLNGAWVLLRRLLLESREPLPFTSAYWGRLGLWAAAMMVCVMLEYLAAPVLLSAAAKLVL